MSAIDREHVIWAYRMFLGREPESAQVVDQLVGISMESLRDAFMRSDEFMGQMPQAPAAVKPIPRRVHIDRVDSQDTLGLLLKHIGEEWAELGKADPHWSVLTSDEYRQDEIQKNREAFYGSGIHEVKFISLVLDRNGLKWPREGSCTEYGCGVGRVTLPLATQCASVLGVDISGQHLELARKEAARAQSVAGKIEWMHLKGIPELENLPKTDMIYSRIVLQHNPPPIIEVILRRLLASLKPGGVAIFQVPTFIPNYTFRISDYMQALQSGQQKGMEMHMLPQCRVLELVEEAGCLTREVFADEAAGPVYTSHTFVVQARA